MSKIPLRFYPHCAAHYTQRIRMSLTSRVIAIHRHKGGSCTSSRSYKGNTDRNKGGRIRKGFQTNTLTKTINSYLVSPTRRWTSRKHSQTEHCRISERSHFWKRSAKTGSSKPQKKNYMKKNCKLQSVSRYQGGSIHQVENRQQTLCDYPRMQAFVGYEIATRCTKIRGWIIRQADNILKNDE